MLFSGVAQSNSYHDIHNTGKGKDKEINQGTELVFLGRRSKEAIFHSRAVTRLLSTAL